MDDSAGVSPTPSKPKGGRDAVPYSATIAMALETTPALDGSVGKNENS